MNETGIITRDGYHHQQSSLFLICHSENLQRQRLIYKITLQRLFFRKEGVMDTDNIIEDLYHNHAWNRRLK
ncbi:MAG: hypothetical protein EGR48_01690 [Lachnospiraceae bacterium]|nr:hypothetical protein [Lachnospiraceae bacterium]